MDNGIQFVANYEDWVAIKKLRIEPQTNPKTIMEFLASLTNGIDAKVEANLRKTVNLDALDAVLQGINPGKSEEEIAAAIKELNTRAVSQKINEITSLPQLQANEKKELQGFCRAYAARKILKKAGVEVDYSEIEIPGMKRLKKTKT